MTRAGVTRDQMVHHFIHPLNPATWDLIRNGVVSNVLYKTGQGAGVGEGVPRLFRVEDEYKQAMLRAQLAWVRSLIE